MLRTAFAFALFFAAAAPAAAQAAPGYLVYGADNGVAFVESDSAADGSWPLAFYYFQDGASVGSARMTGVADCGRGVLSGQLREVNGGPVPPGPNPPQFTFDRSAGGGDQAIVDFACAVPETRAAAVALAPGRTAEAAAIGYVALRGIGLEHGPAADLAARGASADDPAVTAIEPEDLRTRVRDALTPVG